MVQWIIQPWLWFWWAWLFKRKRFPEPYQRISCKLEKCIRDFFLFSNRAKEQDISHSFYGMQQQMLEWDMQLVLMEKFI